MKVLQVLSGREKELLGRFEYSVLRAIEALGENAYGAEIGRFLHTQSGREVTAPQVYMTLERLVKRHLVTSQETKPLHQQGGRRRRRFLIETEGARAMARTAAAFRASPFTKELEDEKLRQYPA